MLPKSLSSTSFPGPDNFFIGFCQSVPSFRETWSTTQVLFHNSPLHSFEQLSFICVLCLPNSSCNCFSGLPCSTSKHIWLRGSYFLTTLSKNTGNLFSSKYLSLDSFLLLVFTDFIVFCLLFLSEGDSIRSCK